MLLYFKFVLVNFMYQIFFATCQTAIGLSPEIEWPQSWEQYLFWFRPRLGNSGTVRRMGYRLRNSWWIKPKRVRNKNGIIRMWWVLNFSLKYQYYINIFALFLNCHRPLDHLKALRLSLGLLSPAPHSSEGLQRPQESSVSYTLRNFGALKKLKLNNSF